MDTNPQFRPNPVAILHTAARIAHESERIALRLDAGHDPDRRHTRNDFASIRIALRDAEAAAIIVTDLIEAARHTLAAFDSEIHNEYDGTNLLENRLAEVNDLRAILAAFEGGA